MLKYKFNNAVLKPYFLKKVKIANYMLQKFTHIKVYSSTNFEKSILVKDEKRNVYISVYIGKKCKGFGTGKVNRCQLNFHFPENKDIHLTHLTKTDLNVYENEIDNNLI